MYEIPKTMSTLCNLPSLFLNNNQNIFYSLTRSILEIPGLSLFTRKAVFELVIFNTKPRIYYTNLSHDDETL